MRTLICFGMIATALAAVGEVIPKPFAELDPGRVEQIAPLLPEGASGFGLPSTRREVWGDPQFAAQFPKAVAEAEKLLKQDFPAWDDEAYLMFSRTGSRSEGERMQGRRGAWLDTLVLAECLENKGRFLSKINSVLGEYAKEKTWTLAAHDRSLKNFKGTEYDVDLRSSAFAAELAQALYLLGDKLDLEVRARVLAAIEQKVFAPMRASFRTGKGNYWLRAEHNWNSVCLNGVVCAALAALPDRRERATYVAAAEHYGDYFIAGFGEDGYCTEGAGYWNYGFGNFVTLRERVLQATGGRVDLFRDPRIRAVALYGLRVQMADRMAPPYSDCHTGSRPDDWIVRYCNLTLGLGVRGYDPPLGIRTQGLVTCCMDAFPNAAARPAAAAGENTMGPRSYFQRAGILISRPGSNGACRLTASIKAGGNGNHSHNDIGSFIVQLGNEFMAGEPGGPRRYTAKTFSAQRYDIPVIGSFGHPVPVLAGKFQLDATKVKPRVLRTEFTEAQDEMVIDLTPAYDAPGLKKLVRTFRFSREGQGSVVVEDQIEFTAPQPVELALPTAGSWKKAGDRVLEITKGRERIRVGIQTPDGYEVEAKEIDESSPVATRIGIKLKKPVQSATVRMAFVPADGEGAN